MKNYNKTTPIKITVEGGLSPDRSLQLTMNAYSTLEEWIEAFKVILLHQTFSEDTIKELFEEPFFEGDLDKDEIEAPMNDWKTEF
jgi:hypothetical protein